MLKSNESTELEASAAALANEELSHKLKQKIEELESLSTTSNSPLDAEKFRKSAFRLRVMQTESSVFELVGKQISLNKFRRQSDAKAEIAELAKFAKLKPEQQQVADLYRQLNMALLGAIFPYALSIAFFLFCAIWLFD
ncbi:hypothetical protein LIN78_08910 [Leeia sp. TBRC 13508]|uniref:Uncharacterized protein n=1 Tax=Leeia speluncae TaxID=2884804 RepID=A0ABS8D641_9NEIS|nr:hypothetical protein [Leeia speluncae]MCB6183668.1 hypothetical protein [Leeia speluncae]